jgi:hypothetical protein
MPIKFKKEQWCCDADQWDYGTGMPGISLFANALQVWSCRQHGGSTVAQAAMAFNISPENVIEAVDYHPWMLLTGPDDDYTKMEIEHDGE